MNNPNPKECKTRNHFSHRLLDIGLDSIGYENFVVNYSKEFKDSKAGAHTQNIESSWQWMCRQLSRGGGHTDSMDQHLS